MSNRTRGNAWELRIKKYLESLGFKVDKARAAIHFIGPGKCFSSACDFLDSSDLLGVHSAKPYTLFIQATLGTLGPRKAKCEAVPWNLAVQRVEVWSRAESIQSGVRVQRLMPPLNAEGSPLWIEFFFRMKDGVPPADPALL